MKTKLKFFLCTIIVTLLFISCFNNSNKNSENDSNVESASTEPIFKVDTTFLHAYMSGNQVAADEKYKDKRFSIKGYITSITNMYEPIIKVETEVGGVDCVFDKSQSQELAKLSTGQNIVIEGIFKGIITSVRFDNCKIILADSQQ